MTTGKTTALTRRTFVSKVMSLLFSMLSRFVTAFLPRSKHLLISYVTPQCGTTEEKSTPSEAGKGDQVPRFRNSPLFLAEPCGLQELSFPSRDGVLALKAPVLTIEPPWNSQKISSYHRHYTSPNLLCDLCSYHPPFFPSTPTMPAFILFPEYVTLISTHGAFAVPSVMDSFAKYLCIAASFLSDQVSSSQKKKSLCFTIYATACFSRATSKLTLWCLPERTCGC